MSLLDIDSLRERFINYLAESGKSLKEVSEEMGISLPVVSALYANKPRRYELKTKQILYKFLKEKGF